MPVTVNMHQAKSGLSQFGGVAVIPPSSEEYVPWLNQ